MTEHIFNTGMLEMLVALEMVLRRFQVDFYLVGAIARDIHFSASPALAPSRSTRDVDIAVMLADEDQFYDIKDALLSTGEFTAHPTEAIKLFYKQAIEIDILPFGDIEDEYREIRIHKPRSFTMDVPGFQEMLPHTKEITVTGNIRLKVCSLEGLVLLKLIAYDDNPTRIKDITDIEHIITVYFDLQDQEIYQEHLDVIDRYDAAAPNYLQLISARVIGRKIGILISDSNQLHKRAIDITRKRLTNTWQALADGLEEIKDPSFHP